jgi:hypothetical protein
MNGTKITLTGADEAHFQSVVGLSSRVVRFPDGLGRHITLRNWEWEVVDRLSEQKGWAETALPELAFLHAKEFCADASLFENQLRRSFSSMIRVNMSYCMDCDRPPSNSEFPS